MSYSFYADGPKGNVVDMLFQQTKDVTENQQSAAKAAVGFVKTILDDSGMSDLFPDGSDNVLVSVSGHAHTGEEYSAPSVVTITINKK